MTGRYLTVYAIVFGFAGFALPALAGQEHLDTLQRKCGVQLNLSATGCRCVADKAGAELNDVQQAFVAAQVTKNMAEIMRIQGGMTQNEMIGAGTFMTMIVQACGG